MGLLLIIRRDIGANLRPFLCYPVQTRPASANGGPTLTHALLTGSPAIDAGNPAAAGSGGAACEITDQRGYSRPADGDANGSMRCDIGAYEVNAVLPTRITYTYDRLYRLTAADYSTGPYFHYTYDGVGNRLTQATLTNTTVYTYDIANRLTNVGAQAYTWDNNGNLLSDGASTYAYDSANRLATLKQGTALTYTYSYNGLGDRFKQVVNGVATTYTLDLNAGLTQVLADGTNTYLYGNGRIAQYAGTTPAYFLPDALGSVRQLTNSAGQVTLAKSYQPYGSVLSSAGSGTSIYGWDGEQRDNTGMVFLRARYYSSYLNQWIQPDPIIGQFTNPQTLNRYSYVNNNPINYTDPSGETACLPSSAGDRRECQPPRTDKYSEKTPPRNITWNPAVSVLPIKIFNYLGEEVPPGTDQSQFRITDPEGVEVTGACGPLTVAAILQLTGNLVFRNAYKLKYDDVFEGKPVRVPVTPNYTGYKEVIAIIRAYEGWDAYTVTNISKEDAPNQLRLALSAGRYPIPSVVIGGTTGKVGAGTSLHWLAVTGLSQEWNRGKDWQWVRVYNPFDNETEYYWWEHFLKGWPEAGRFMIVMHKSSNWRLGGP